MPIYEYLCPECNVKFEKMRPVSQSDQDAECPKCHKSAPRKMSLFNGFVTNHAGVPQAVGGSNSSSCGSCSSGNCGSCGS